MKDAPFRGPLNKLIHVWCDWCVKQGRVIEFQDWLRYTHTGDTARLIRETYADHDAWKTRLRDKSSGG